MNNLRKIIKTAPRPCDFSTGETRHIREIVHRTGLARRMLTPQFKMNPVTKIFHSLTAALALLAGATSASACGMPTSLPSSPFMGSQDYRMSISEQWGRIRLSPKTELEIGGIFTPVLNHANSRILGVGWKFPVFESTCLVASDKGDYKMEFPSGHSETLHRTRTSNQLKGSNWLATIEGPTITAKSSCGWTLTYKGGRLAKIRTPEGTSTEFFKDNQGSYWLKVDGTPVLTLKRDFDADGKLIYHLHQSGGKHAILKIGTRPLLYKIKERINGRDVEKEKTKSTETLVAIKQDGEPEKRYDFTGETLLITVANKERYLLMENYRWDAGNGGLKSSKEVSYSFQKIQGVLCLRKTWEDWSFSIAGDDAERGITISKDRRGTRIVRTDVFQGTKTVNGKVKSRFFVDSQGRQTLIEKCHYDENGNLVKHLNNGMVTKYSPEKIETRDVETDKILTLKKFDAKGQIREFESENVIYSFNNFGETTEVSVFSKNRSLLSRVNVASSDIQKTFPSNQQQKEYQ